MSVTGAIVIYAVAWFITLIVVIPRGLRTQAEAGAVEPGTPAGAPEAINLMRKFWITTIIATTIWAAICSVIHFELLTLKDFDFLLPASFKETPAAFSSGG
ncbi:MAG: DUF1467 family protein [Pseudomonadota bacterium]